MQVIHTVTGDVPADHLGVTYMHEHLIGQALSPDDPDLILDSEANAIAELRAFYAAGGRAVVEMSPRDWRRDVLALRRISTASQVQIITVTGFIKSKSAAPLVSDKTINQIADEMIREITEGIDGTNIRAGVIKAGTSLNTITADEEKVLRAAARAQRETGALISTHTEAGTMALEQIALLRGEGVPPERILIGHMDRHIDWAYHVAVAQTGVTLGYDQFGKAKYYPDSVRVAFVRRMVAAGFGAQLAISGDMARRSSFASYGGAPGFTHILSVIVPMLHDAGLTQAEIDTLLIATPARLLGITKAG